jgi:hypothetical protein
MYYNGKAALPIRYGPNNGYQAGTGGPIINSLRSFAPCNSTLASVVVRQLGKLYT